MPSRAVKCGRRRHEPGRDDADGAVCRRQPRDRGAVRRRVRHLRLGQGTRPPDRQDSLDRPQHGPRLADVGTAGTRALHRGREHRRLDVAGRFLAPRWRTGLGLDLLRCPARPHLLRDRQSRSVQHRAAPGREQMDQQRARAAAARRSAGVGVSVHAARQLGLRLERRDDSGRPGGRRATAQSPGAFRQERLRVHDRPQERRAARRRAVRECHVGETHQSVDRPARARHEQDDRRLSWRRERDLPESRGRQEPRLAVFVFATHGAVLHGDQQSLHELCGRTGDAHCGDAVHRRDDTVFRRAWRQHGRVSGVGRGARA